MPSFNQVGYLETAIRSVLDQGYPNLELLVMDGGSTDGSVELLERYRDRLSFVSGRDGGQSAALNTGFSRVKGEVIGWLNSDDLYAPGALYAVGGHFSRNPDCEWLYGRCPIVDQNGKEIRRAITWYKERSLRKFSYRRLLFENFISQPAVFFRRRLLERVGLLDPNLHYAMDYDLWLRMSQVAPPHFLDLELACFRSSGDNKMSTGFDKSFREEYAVADKNSQGNHPWMLRIKAANRYKLLFAYRLMALTR